MKTLKSPIFLIVLAVSAWVLAGCGLPSVYPFYTEKDVVFDPALLGVWLDPSDANDRGTSFEKKGDDGYAISDMRSNETNVYSGRLFRLKNQLFLDCVPDERNQFIPPHFLFKVDQAQASLKLIGLNEEWLQKLLEKQTNALRHFLDPNPSGNPGIILTADTAELQKFLIANLNTKEAFSDPKELKRQ